MIISHRHRFIFVKTQKTAGTSLEVFLSSVCSDDDVVTPIWPEVPGHRHRNHRGLWNPLPEIVRERPALVPLRDLSRGHRFYNHLAARRIRARVGALTWQDYLTFCVERNPWDKVLSHYWFVRSLGRPSLTLDRYLEEGQFPLNSPIYTEQGDPSRVIVDRVLRYENLDDELAALFAELGVPFSGRLDVRAKSTYRKDRRPYREVLDESQARIIERAFADEISLHRDEF